MATAMQSECRRGHLLGVPGRSSLECEPGDARESQCAKGGIRYFVFISRSGADLVVGRGYGDGFRRYGCAASPGTCASSGVVCRDERTQQWNTTARLG